MKGGGGRGIITEIQSGPKNKNIFWHIFCFLFGSLFHPPSVLLLLPQYLSLFLSSFFLPPFVILLSFPNLILDISFSSFLSFSLILSLLHVFFLFFLIIAFCTICRRTSRGVVFSFLLSFPFVFCLPVPLFCVYRSVFFCFCSSHGALFPPYQQEF
uniref:Uncharacterized protein n=1 Tax=Cacopsylla melanoneura TaxID=428564 RepID=A0A8D9BAY3_9HEMI